MSQREPGRITIRDIAQRTGLSPITVSRALRGDVGCGRQARLVELDPAYCDVIVQRWQRFSGRAAIVDGNGESFEAIASARRAASGQRPSPSRG